ncbi:MAG TPA: hypothetical protein VHE35_06935 [Kofleriaceae bacterium]|nr:hypothetical protein [Kofleriaceae bacterium]
MRKVLATVLFAAATTAAGACAPHTATKTFVKVDQVALGRVVVYRNGVAYYERKALVQGGKLTVSVPRDRVDDFLKSLTVVDAKTQLPLPVTFPRTESGGGPYLEMTLQVPTARNPGETAEVTLTYVTESPVWKPSYRIAFPDKTNGGKVMLEGWAIVDNTSGEDWKDVEVGVGSSSAMSFRYDLWSVRTVQRETLANDAQFAVAPPTAVSPYGGSGGGEENQALVAQLDDDEIRRPLGHPDNLEEAKKDEDQTVALLDEGDAEEPAPTAAPAGGTGRGAGRDAAKVKDTRARIASLRAGMTAPEKPYEMARQHAAPQDKVADGDRKILSLAPQIINNRQNVVIEGYADPDETGSDQRALDRANIVRNQLIDAGVPPAQVKVVDRGVVPGQRAGVRMIAETPPPDTTENGAPNAAAPTDAAPVGESYFRSPTPMTVDRGTSVMVSMVRQETSGEEVYLYDSESDRGNDRFAFRAVRLKNPTDSTLETGPVTVYGDGRYIGEGLTEPIPPKASVVVPFALDRQVVVDRDSSTENQVSRLVTLQRGILTAEVQHIKKTKLTFTSRLHVPTKVYVRHTVQKGWMLLDAPEVREKIGDASLFEVDLGAGETKTVELSEATPLTRTLDLASPTTLDMMKVFVDSPNPGPELKKQLEDLLAIHREVVDTGDKITSLRERATEYRERMDELNDQIVSLRKVKKAGALQKSLQDKMVEISDRVQKTTLDIVDSQEQLMLAKVRFQDALAELTLPDAAGALAVGAPAPAAPAPAP